MQSLLRAFILASTALAAACGRQPLVLTPAPCERMVVVDTEWQGIPLPAQAGSLQLPRSYRPNDSTAIAWIAPGRGAIIVQLQREAIREPNTAHLCRVRVGMRQVRLSTDVAYGDPVPTYVTVAQWELATGDWLVMLGTALDSVAQVEQVTAIYSLAP